MQDGGGVFSMAVILKLGHELLLRAYRGVPSSVPYRVRVHKERAKEYLKWLDANVL